MILYQAIQTSAMMLYYYYLSYKRLPLHLDQDVLNQFTSHIIQLFKWKFPTMSLTTDEFNDPDFILFDEPFDEIYQSDTRENMYSSMLHDLIEFPLKHSLIITDDYTILQILPIPFDSLAITHGMIINFFTPILDR